MKRVFIPLTLGLFLALFITGVVAARQVERAPAPDPNVPDVELGEPGLKHTYSETIALTGQAYPSNSYLLNRPRGIFIDSSDNIYVAEEFGSRMLKYDSTGTIQLSIGEPGFGKPWEESSLLNSPDVTLDSSGNIWMVDEHRVVAYDSNGVFLNSFPEGQAQCGGDNAHFCNPRGLAFDSLGRLYVSDRDNHRVQVFSVVSNTLTYSTTIGITGAPGDDDADFDSPEGIVIDSSNRVYVADTLNFRVQRCTYASGWSCVNYDGTGIYGDELGEIGWAEGLGIDGSQNIYIADDGNGRVKKCDPAGVCTEVVPKWSYTWGADVAVDSSGNIYLTDFGDCTILKYASDGAFVEVFVGTTGVPYNADATRLNYPFDLALTPDGGFLVSEKDGFRLIKYDANGVQDWIVGEAGIWDYWFPSDDYFGEDGPAGVAADALGRAFVADTGYDRVQIFDASGNYVDTLGEPGEPGSDNDHFIGPMSVAVSPLNGDIFVVDTGNQRVQVFTSALVYSDTLGTTGVPGTGINRFNQPYDVAVGLDGKVFVADLGNHRVQVYSSQLDYVDTIGITGNCSPQFDTLCDPSSVSVDAMGRVYISDQYPRIKVYDADGAYIATIGGVLNLGDGVQDFGGASGLAVDPNGLVYVADSWNHRVQVYTPLGNGWEQVNVSGFGILEHQVDALASFDGQLYAGGGGSEGFASLWRKDGDWVQITGGGFGMFHIHSFQSLYEYNGRLYAGTRSDENYGAQVWRSITGAPGTWSQVVGGGFGDPMNAEILSFAGFDGRVYASTASYTDSNGAEVWGSPSGDFSTWTQSGVHGFDGNSDNRAITSLQVHNLYLYASTTNEATGTEVWRSADGIVWSHVNLGGFGDVYNISANLASVDGTLYAGTYNYDGSDNPGGELWSCQVCDGNDWALVDKGFGDPENRNVEHVRLYNGMLYAFVANHETGLQIWTKTGVSGWMQVNPDGFGDYQNRSTYYNNAVTTHFGNLYVAIQNFSHGGEIWMKFYEIFLPITVR